MTVEMATSTVPTALPPALAGALCTASCSDTRCVISRWRMRNDSSWYRWVGIRSQSVVACATSGGTTSRPTRTKAATITA